MNITNDNVLIKMHPLTLCSLHYPKLFLQENSWRVICLILQGQTVTSLQHLGHLWMIISFCVVTEKVNIATLKSYWRWEIQEKWNN